MAVTSHVLLLLAFVFNNALTAWSVPGNDGRSGHNVNNSSYNVDSSSYNIDSSSHTEDGQCIQEVTVSGKGVRDSFRHPCSKNGVSVITNDNNMILGDPEKDSFSLFSDKPSTLVVIENGECTKKAYTTTSGQTTSTSSPMSETECAAVKKELKEIREKFLKELEEQLKEQQEARDKAMKELQEQLKKGQEDRDKAMKEMQEQLKKEQEEREKKLKEQMANMFPPGFPFNTKATTSTNSHTNGTQRKSITSGSTGQSSSESSGSGTPAVGSAAWREALQKRIAKRVSDDLKKTFPSGFPFNKQ